VSDLALELEGLRGPRGEVLAAGFIRLNKVEWVDINAPYDVETPSTNPDYQPDPLPPVDAVKDRFAAEPGKNLVFWLTVEVPEAVRPGTYRGQVRLLAGGRVAAAIALELRVRNFALPKTPILQSMIGLAESNIYKAHGCKTRDEKEKIIRTYFDEYIRARLSPFLYATGTMAFNPLPDGQIKWEFVKAANGQPAGEAVGGQGQPLN